MYILGISAFYHDSAAALIDGDRVVAAAQEERFTRQKNDADFPIAAIEYCLSSHGLSLEDIDYVAFYDKPILTFSRLIETYLAFAPRGLRSFMKALPVWVKEKALQRNAIINGLNSLDLGKFDEERLKFGFHHHSHAASAFYPSPFDEAAVMVLDGVGEWATASLGVGEGKNLRLEQEIRFPHSIGMLYSAFTYYLGFKVNEGEYKVMGLAPYGEPTFENTIRDHLIDIRVDGSFHLDMQYFNYCTGLTMTNERFDELFGGPPRKPDHPLTQRDMDLARSVQVVTEDVVIRLCRSLRESTGKSNLCLAGGVALNCVANGKVLREEIFDQIWVQPAAGDAGGAIGAALSVAHDVAGIERSTKHTKFDGMLGAYLGPSFSDDEITAVLDNENAKYRVLPDKALFNETVEALSDERIVGWFQGRMEFGPRALGNRSIIGDPRSARMQREMNLKIKYRESFRPFAPAVLRDEVADYFELDTDSPYMLIVADVKADQMRTLSESEKSLQGLDRLDAIRSAIPAVTHVDGSARVQTVHPQTNPRFHQLLATFKDRTGCGVLINTSFNIADEPVVCSPLDAYRCFMGSEMDVLVMGNVMLLKEDQ